ncbi:MAG: alkaline phosphatase family protein [Nocardioidaceae bacterium]
MRSTRLLLGAVSALALVAGGAVAAASAPQPRAVQVAATTPPPIRHVFVINLENEGYTSTFGAGSKAPYLATTLRNRGVLLTQYYGTAHHSLPNYVAQISGQGPSKATQRDCKYYTAFQRTGTVAPGQAVGTGCVYPAKVRTVADQLISHGYTWRAYLEDMGTGCRHPRLGALDTTQKARVGDQYAARHNPFVYFRSITSLKSCASRDVGLSHLVDDLKTVRTTRNLTYITPNLCDDGHDSPCVDGRSGGLTTANTWLQAWVPRILASPAFKRNGLLVVTFDEAESGDARATPDEGPAPNVDQPGITGPGGGRVGAVLVSPFLGTGTSTQPYNHYSLLRSVEDWFGLPYLGYARTTRSFGSDVFSHTP